MALSFTTPAIRRGIKTWWQTEVVKYYYGNTVEYNANVIGAKRIREAREYATGELFDAKLRRDYERDYYSWLKGYSFDPEEFESIRARAVAVLADPGQSPCVWNSGDRGAALGIPSEVIKHDLRRYTKDVAAVVPDIGKLFNPQLVHAIRSCIGSNFYLEDVILTRNYHLDVGTRARYELLSDRWHFDDQYADGFSLAVCLSYITEADGPFHALGRKDSRAILRRGFQKSKRTASISGGIRETEIERMPSFSRLIGPPGTMLLCHTSFCLHRAGVPAEGRYRDMMFITFRPSEKMDLSWPRRATA